MVLSAATRWKVSLRSTSWCRSSTHPRVRKHLDARKGAYETRRWNSNKSAGLGNTAAGAVSKDVGKALLNSYKCKPGSLSLCASPPPPHTHTRTI